MLRRLITVGLMLPLLSPLARADDPPWVARSKTGMVASDSTEASQIGADVLTQGGNAFDAAIATSCALAVSRPQSTGLGGGGFLVAYVAKEKRFVALDFREVAPAGATRERYAQLAAEAGDGPPPSIYGGNASGVPGLVAGLAEIHRRYATRPWRDLVLPASKLADTGFRADDTYEGACRKALKDIDKWPQLKEQHAELYRTLLGGGKGPADGDTVKRPDLAEALRILASDGPHAFYEGPLGAALVKANQAAGGVLTTEDLAAYRVREREPLHAMFNGHEIIAMPPPSSGGVCIIETLNILSAFAADFPGGLPAMRNDNYPPALVTALKHSFADRARWLGDPDFCRVPVALLTSPAYAAKLIKQCPTQLDDFGSPQLPDDQGTSHFSIIDKNGNVVAFTETINGNFGSFVVAAPYGIVLNNQMDDFATDPGKPNLFGLIQGEGNAVAPGKRPLSCMSPTIVLKDGQPVLVLGASGGPLIITSVLQVLLNVVEFRLPLDEALTAVRIHHQWRPDEVNFDRDPPGALVETLKGAGHTISTRRRTGIVQAIQVLPDGTLVGASDVRKGGRPAGAK